MWHRPLDLTVDTSDNARGGKSDSISPFCIFALSNQNTLFHVISLVTKATFLFVTPVKKVPFIKHKIVCRESVSNGMACFT